MTLSVDFNMRDHLGRIPALIPGSDAWYLEPGQLVIAEDDEGNRCKAQVEEIAEARGVAYLRLVPGTSEPSFLSEIAAEEEQEASDEDRLLLNP